MENFWKKKFSNEQKISSQSSSSDDDAYIQDIQKRLQSKATGGIMNEGLDRFYSDQLFDFEEKNKIASNRIKSLFYLYASLFGALANTSLIYYPSIKFVKKVFRLKGFWNIHFAALPIIMNWNAITLGIATGIYQTIQSQNLINQMKQKSSYNIWKV